MTIYTTSRFSGTGGGGGGFELGPAQNTFSGTNEAAADGARDTYATANTAWLAEYDVAASYVIAITYGTTTKYQSRRDNGSGTQVWRDVTGLVEGPKGQSGPTGPAGIGPTGVTGPTGATGAGRAGPTGTGVRGPTGGQGVQGRFYITIYRNAQATPATPMHGSYIIGRDILIPPASWTASITTTYLGELTYISRSDVNPATQTGTIVPVWSTPVQAGSRGAPGATGPTSTVPGPSGATGAASTVPGPRGATGGTGPASTVAGPTGATGGTGPASTVAGPTGATGPRGPGGGATGATGPASTVPGPKGATGGAGADSTVPGPRGATGGAGADSTVPGPKGATGVAGATGPTSTVPGPQGPTGATGSGGGTGTGTGSSLLVTPALPAVATLTRTNLAAVGGDTDSGLSSPPYYRREAVGAHVTLRADRLGAGRVGLSTYPLGDIPGRGKAGIGGELEPPIPGLATIAVEPITGVAAHAENEDRDIVLRSNVWQGAVTDGMTLWFLSSGGAVEAHNPVTLARDATKDFIAGSGTWHGATSDGTILWLLDDFTNEAQAYVAATRGRRGAHDISLGVGEWRAATSDGTTLWFVEILSGIAWARAYAASSPPVRDAGKDIKIGALDIGAASSDKQTLWFISRSGNEAVAYDAETRIRDEKRDFALPAGGYNAAVLLGDTMWVVDQQQSAQTARAMTLTAGGLRLVMDSVTGGPLHEQQRAINVFIATVSEKPRHVSTVLLSGPADTSRANTKRWISERLGSTLLRPGEIYSISVTSNSNVSLGLHPGDYLTPLLDNPLLDVQLARMASRTSLEIGNRSPVVDVSRVGAPDLDEHTFHQLHIDHFTPRVWVGQQVPAPGIPASSESTAFPASGKYLGAFVQTINAPSENAGYIQYDFSYATWLRQTPGVPAVNDWTWVSLEVATSEKHDFPDTYHWLGVRATANAAAGFVVGTFVAADIYLYYNTTNFRMERLTASTFVAAIDHTWRYLARSLASREDLVDTRSSLENSLTKSLRKEILADTIVDGTSWNVSDTGTGQAVWLDSQRIPFTRYLRAEDENRLLSVYLRWYERRTGIGGESTGNRRHFSSTILAATFIDMGSRQSGTNNSLIHSADFFVARPDYRGTLGKFAEMKISYARYRDTTDSVDGMAFNFGRGTSMNDTDIRGVQGRFVLFP